MARGKSTLRPLEESNWVAYEDSEGTQGYVLPGTDDHGSGDDLHVINLDGFGGQHGLEVGGWPLTWDQVDRLVGVLTEASERWKGG